jgi:hypothetical protein
MLKACTALIFRNQCSTPEDLHLQHQFYGNVKSWRRVSCRKLFKKFNISSFGNEYLFSSVLFIVDNIEEFNTNLEIMQYKCAGFIT